MHTTVICRWCGTAIGLRHFELFDHASCARLLPSEALIPEAQAPLSAWQLAKNFARVQRYAARRGVTLLRSGPAEGREPA